MAMNGDALGDAMKAAVDAAVSGGGEVDRQAMFRALGTAIVTYITANAVVVVASVSGVTTGVSASGPGAGTVT